MKPTISTSNPTSPDLSGNSTMTSFTMLAEARKAAEVIRAADLSDDNLYFTAAVARELLAEVGKLSRRLETEQARRYRALREAERQGKLSV